MKVRFAIILFCFWQFASTRFFQLINSVFDIVNLEYKNPPEDELLNEKLHKLYLFF